MTDNVRATARAANTDAPAQAERRRRIQVIISIMGRGEWVRGETGRVLADSWGVREDTVSSYASEASRMLDTMIHDRDQIEDLCRYRLREIALEDGRDRVPAIEIALKNVGRLVERQDVSVTTGAPELTISRAASALVRDPAGLSAIVEQLRLHAPEMLAPTLREAPIETVGETSHALPGSHTPE